jgi:hypothetical protein
VLKKTKVLLLHSKSHGERLLAAVSKDRKPRKWQQSRWTFNKVLVYNSMRKEWSLQQMVLGQPDIYIQTMRSDPFLTPSTQIISKWTTDLNIRAKTYKSHKRKHKGKSLWPQVRQCFLRYNVKNTSDKRKIINLEFIKILSICLFFVFANLFCFVFWCSTGDRAQGLEHARQVLYH